MPSPHLRSLTTLRCGGPADTLVEARSDEQVIESIRAADSAGTPTFVLGGGSNVVVADDGFSGTVIQMATRGIRRDGNMLTVAAGEPWDGLVARCVHDGLRGIECMSGIPGSVGATPIQNVGAYGQEVSDVITSVKVFDRLTGRIANLANGACGFAYRESFFKANPDRWVILSVGFSLTASTLSAELGSEDVRGALGGDERAPLADVRSAVLRVRARKGMVLDESDPNSRSVGSFFVNPLVSAERLAVIEHAAAERPPANPVGDGSFKTSAAWLIERAGFPRGYGDPEGAAISSKHALALTNRGHASAAEVVALAREIAEGVHRRFGVVLDPEPVFVGHAW